ncbi:Branched-chain amino acid transport ATP-binding protein LivG (TC 3.A.1.4.1) [hydrothermal vent metagenome]|uniref:Branched-chain amino acid transport ATP-binding protein LivG (TC 3.A.1.4.1) n=1 Tax=hydrothermal vent metagenome TaxID=652676 RepID=A0A3B0TJW1_9ZZZZ
MAAVNLLTATGLTRYFGGLRAVDNIDFELPQGQIRALIGPNGAGKTTFVGMICGRVSSDSGKVIFQGRDVTDLAAHARISLGMAYTFQITSIFAQLTLFENVALAVRRRLGRDASAVANEVEAVLTRVGLAGRTTQTAGDLAYGHQRLLEIAMGLGQRPRLLILDEPTQGLADSEIEDFVALVKSIAGETTVLLIEHNMNVVMATADTITVLNFGQVLAEGAPADIRANADVQAAYLGTG